MKLRLDNATLGGVTAILSEHPGSRIEDEELLPVRWLQNRDWRKLLL